MNSGTQTPFARLPGESGTGAFCRYDCQARNSFASLHGKLQMCRQAIDAPVPCNVSTGGLGSNSPVQHRNESKACVKRSLGFGLCGSVFDCNPGVLNKVIESNPVDLRRHGVLIAQVIVLRSSGCCAASAVGSPRCAMPGASGCPSSCRGCEGRTLCKRATWPCHCHAMAQPWPWPNGRLARTGRRPNPMALGHCAFHHRAAAFAAPADFHL